MAHTITPQTLESGNKFVVVKYTIAGDSKTATELVNAVLFDASSFANKTKNKLYDISYDLNGFSAELLWDASAPVKMISLAKDHPNRDAYITVEGGLINNAGTGRTGDILITTTGLASSSNVGHIILRVAWRE
jgi:hypothetical protein